MSAIIRPAFDAVHALAEAEICNLALVRCSAEEMQDTEENTLSGRACRSVYAKARNSLLRRYCFNFAKKTAMVPRDTSYLFIPSHFSYAFSANDPVVMDVTNDTTPNLVTSTDPDPKWIGRVVSGTNVAPNSRILSIDALTSTIVLDRPTIGVVTSVIIRIPLLKVVKIDPASDAIDKFQTVGDFGNRKIVTDACSGSMSDGSLALEIEYMEEVINPSMFDSLFHDALYLLVASKIAPVVSSKNPTLRNQILEEFLDAMRGAVSASGQESEVDGEDERWTDRY